MRETEKYKVKDEEHKKKVDSKNALEKLCAQHEVHGEGREGGWEAGAGRQRGGSRRRSSGSTGTSSRRRMRLEHKLRELENLCNPIITKEWQGPLRTRGGGAYAAGPKIEEVD